jgi:hypothetical protein
MKPALIGYMPSKIVDGSALGGTIGTRLLRWAGIATKTKGDDIVEYFDTFNLNPYREGVFDEDLAQDVVSLLKRNHVNTPWVLCGRAVAKRFALTELPFWVWDTQRIIIPHPSGRCRLYNVEANRIKTGKILREALGLT